MNAIPTSRPRNARSVRRFSTGHGGARSITILASQLVHRSSSFDSDRYCQSTPIMGRDIIDQHIQSRHLRSHSPSAALKSPQRTLHHRRPLAAVSSLGGFRTPAAGVRGTACERPASETLHRCGCAGRAR
jgi:hypothetical protein